jgi:hypothetical protein
MASTLYVHLPTEALQLIFSTFCLHCRAKHQLTAPDGYLRGTYQHRDERSWYSLECQTLFSLCLVSRRFRDIAQPILYHEFVPGYGDSWRSTVYVWDGRLTSFIRTILQRRDLALLVKRIYIHPYLLKPIGNEEAQDALEQAIYTLGIKSWQQLSGNDLVTILIAELPNLEHFSLQVDTFPSKSISSSGLRSAGVSRLPLRTIDISLHATPRQASRNLFSLDFRARAIFELATGLETLNLHMCGSIWNRTPIPSLPNLKTLRITYSRLGEKDIKRLLSSCTGLRTFVYTATDPPMDMYSPMVDGRDHFQLSNAVRYLSRHRATLKTLHLDLRARWWSPFTDGKIRPVFTLRDFSVLEHLFLNSSEIYSRFWAEKSTDPYLLVQLLPLGIVSLHLAGHIGNILPCLAKGLLRLADAISRGQLPRLEQVRCDAEQRLDEYAVEAAFAAAGVDFGYNSWPRNEATLRASDVPSPPTSPQPLPLPDMDEDCNL